MYYKPGDRISGPDCLEPKVGYVYVLRCPDTDAVRYVGSTATPSSRYLGHLHDARDMNRRIARGVSNFARGSTLGSRREKWLASLILDGKFPIMEIVSLHPLGETVAAERQLWSEYMNAGADLINSRPPSPHFPELTESAK